ncbi:MAG TPA: methionine adenosyltransferase domain-containing protein, partial [Vicinamibacterales bacterium]|nr:methionine adenosyltransferase domain-containing protein [Vicinamibacterales bacterium]
ETFGTGDERAAADFVLGFDFRPRAIIEKLDLLRPIYRGTTNYGHFGRAGLPWEAVAVRGSQFAARDSQLAALNPGLT